jgi:hypothetical protein
MTQHTQWNHDDSHDPILFFWFVAGTFSVLLSTILSERSHQVGGHAGGLSSGEKVNNVVMPLVLPDAHGAQAAAISCQQSH